MDEKKTALEFPALLESAALSGDATLRVGEEGLRCDTLFDTLAVDYADLKGLRLEGFALLLDTAEGTLRLTRLGRDGQGAYDALKAALDERVLACLQPEGAPQLTIRAFYEQDGARGEAEARLYADCLCLLPPDEHARRFPLDFLNALESGEWALTVGLRDGERCRLSRLGRELEPLRDGLTAQLRARRESAAALCVRLCPALGAADAARGARLLCEYVAAPLAALPGALAAALEKKLQNSKMRETLPALAELCDLRRAAVGVHELPEETVEQLKAALLETLNAGGDGPEALTPEQEDALRWALWVAAPARGGGAAVLELALPDEDAATYVFACENFDGFLPRLNRALEASHLRRELLTLSDEELGGPDHAGERILLTRTPALQALRRAFLGRAAHRGAAAWKKSVLTLTQRGSAPQGEAAQSRFCTQCGARLAPELRFCPQCGTKR